MVLIKGKVIRKIQGFYDVLCEKGIYSCKLKGILKKSNNKLNCVIGDIVDFDIDDLVINNIYDRKNLLLRPLVANVDFVAITLSVKDPVIDINNFQKMLLLIDKQEIPLILVLSKIDLVDEDEKTKMLNELNDRFRNIKIFCISLKTKEGLLELEKYIEGKQIILSGASGVGKSSLVNYLLKDDVLEVGDISSKTKKGKNTTIDTRYFETDQIKIFDTPGYSYVSVPEFYDKLDIMEYISEFKPYLGLCKFKNCIHIDEPQCYIKQMVIEDKINIKRYDFYKSLVNEYVNKK